MLNMAAEMAFRFSLEALLKLTKAKLDALREEISLVEERLKGQRLELEGLEAQRQERLCGFSQATSSEWDPRDMSRFLQYLEALADRIERGKLRLRELEAELTSKRAKAFALLQRLRLLEKLYEKQHSEFLRCLKRKELGKLDLHNLGTETPFSKE